MAVHRVLENVCKCNNVELTFRSLKYASYETHRREREKPNTVKYTSDLNF